LSQSAWKTTIFIKSRNFRQGRWQKIFQEGGWGGETTKRNTEN